jgi:hypothetical protein
LKKSLKASKISTNPNLNASNTYANKFIKLNNEINFNFSKSYISKKSKKNGSTAAAHAANAPIRMDGFWILNDQTGTVASPIDPKLSALSSLTSTSLPVLALQSNSPAINAADAAQGNYLPKVHVNAVSSVMLDFEDLVLRVQILHLCHGLAQLEFQLLSLAPSLLILASPLMYRVLIPLAHPCDLLLLAFDGLDPSPLIAEVVHLLFGLPQPALVLIAVPARLVAQLSHLELVLVHLKLKLAVPIRKFVP